jgi:uncharacterized protein
VFYTSRPCDYFKWPFILFYPSFVTTKKNAELPFSLGFKKKFKRIVLVIVIVYFTIGALLYLTQELFFFHPTPLPENYPYPFKQSFKEVNVKLPNGNLNFVKFFPPSDVPVVGAVLYFHGNMTNISRYAANTEIFTKKGFVVFMPDYPGFGKTTGTRTEQRMLSDAQLVYDSVAKEFSKNQIIVYGKSMGTGVATVIAGQNNCKLLVLETPYKSLPALAAYYTKVYPTNFMINYKLNTFKNIEAVKCPIVAFHGVKDEIIPYHLAQAISTKFKPTDVFITINEGKHNNLTSFSAYTITIDSLLKIP